MDEENNQCPICAKHADKELPKDDFVSFTCRQFANPEMVTADTIFNTQYLIDKWLTGKSRHPDPELNRTLIAEEISEQGMEHVKQHMVNFATTTESINLFRDTVDLLVSFKDPHLTPLYKGWINKYFRTYLLHGSTMNTLIDALESSGETVRDLNEDKNDWSENADAVRKYLIETCQIIA